MKTKKLLLLILTFVSLNAFAQVKYTRAKPVLKINLKSLVDAATFPTLQLGIEQEISRNVSVFGEVGYQLYEFGNWIDTNFIKPNGFKSLIELRVYK